MINFGSFRQEKDMFSGDTTIFHTTMATAYLFEVNSHFLKSDSGCQSFVFAPE